MLDGMVGGGDATVFDGMVGGGDVTVSVSVLDGMVVVRLNSK